jgi:hypothetical protein
MALAKIKMIRHVKTVTVDLSGLSGAPGTPVTNDYNITSLGIVDFNKCEIITNMGSADHGNIFFELTSNINLRATLHTGTNNTSVKVQIKEHY